VKSSFFSSSIRSSNFSRVSGTICWAARPQTLLNLVSMRWSKGCTSSLTSLAFKTSVGHVICDLAFHFLDAIVVSDADPPIALESTGAFSSCCSISRSCSCSSSSRSSSHSYVILLMSSYPTLNLHRIVDREAI
jgi:hypothetical protein